MSARADFEQLQRDLDGCLADTVELARSAGAEWRSLVEALRQMRELDGPTGPLPLASGAANPAEVRSVLIAIADLYEHRLRRVERDVDRNDDALVDEIWTFRHRRLASFVMDELASYIKSVAPRPSIASAFGKVAASPSLRAAPCVQLHRCKSCGAPRRADGLYGNCLYCAQPFFTGRKELE